MALLAVLDPPPCVRTRVTHSLDGQGPIRCDRVVDSLRTPLRACGRRLGLDGLDLALRSFHFLHLDTIWDRMVDCQEAESEDKVGRS